MSFRQGITMATALLACCGPIAGQPEAAKPPVSEFEAASIKPSPDEGKLVGVRFRGATLSAKSVNMLGLILYAQEIQPYQVAGGPKWFDSDGFDIDARASNAASGSQFRLMLQALLADRFKLKFHRETRDLRVLGMVLAKDPPKFKELPPGADIGPPWGVGRMRFRNLSEVARAMSLFSNDRPVLNETGLSGDYDLQVDQTRYWQPGE